MPGGPTLAGSSKIRKSCRSRSQGQACDSPTCFPQVSFVPGIRSLRKLLRGFFPLRGREAWPHGAVGNDKIGCFQKTGARWAMGSWCGRGWSEDPTQRSSLISTPQGDMGAAGPAGAPGPKGEKGDTVSEGPSAWPVGGGPLCMGTGGLPAAPASPCTTPPSPTEVCAPGWQ